MNLCQKPVQREPLKQGECASGKALETVSSVSYQEEDSRSVGCRKERGTRLAGSTACRHAKSRTGISE
jgi:hypothetical protein